eukprot:3863690-Pleurochrysis_carterae.AAC.1
MKPAAPLRANGCGVQHALVLARARRRKSLVDDCGALWATCCAHALAVAMLSNNAVAMLSVDARAASKAKIATAAKAATMTTLPCCDRRARSQGERDCGSRRAGGSVRLKNEKKRARGDC